MDKETAEIVKLALETGVVKTALESELLNNLVGPLSKQVGAMGETLASLANFYCNRALRSIFTKWAQQRGGRPLSGEEFARVLPLLPQASFQSEEELQERWAALLESVASQASNVLPSFGPTLSEMTAEEAAYFERICEYMEDVGHRKGASRSVLIAVFDPELKHLTVAKHAVCKERVEHASLLIQDLERLGLLTRREEAGSAEFRNWVDTVKMVTLYTVSDYGRRFIEAVTPKQRQRATGAL